MKFEVLKLIDRLVQHFPEKTIFILFFSQVFWVKKGRNVLLKKTMTFKGDIF